MRILHAKVLGFCFGVRDALQTASEVPEPENVTILGELVHNEQILHQLHVQGFPAVSEAEHDAVPDTPDVLITAHGISDRRRSALIASGKTLHDTTCPLVRNVHRAARKLAAEGRHVIVIGRPGHVEVRGIIEDLASYSVFAAASDVICTGHAKLGVISQSTTSPEVADAVRRRIAELHPDADIRWIDTICLPTKDRQQAVRELLPEIDKLVVVGGMHSNNARALAELARSQGVTPLRVETAGDLRRDWFDDDDVVGLTAGTSTPDDALRAVAETLEIWSRCPPLASQETSSCPRP